MSLPDPQHPSPLALLKQYWGFDGFRPLQEEAIKALLDKRDVLALLATGSGKSVCYQVPALMLPGLTLVVSPLIALMKDQVDALVDKGIPAAALLTGQTWQDTEDILQAAVRGRIKLLYVSPERLETRALTDYLPHIDVGLVAVDEAHCISEWGHDFRPAYRRIAEIKALLPAAPFLALTATATREVRSDIIRQLGLRSPVVIEGPLLRPRLALSVRRTEDKTEALFRFLEDTPGAGIVYCRNRRTTEDLSGILASAGHRAAAYHGGMPTGDRGRIQEAWMRGEVRVMVATNAFGMGIDKPDVRIVLHYDAPDGIENYYQEAGRAGRDGTGAVAVLLYGENDLRTLEALPGQRFPSEEAIRGTYRDLVNFLQIPAETGEMEWYDFSLDTFVARFKRPAAITLHALKALEQEEVLLYADRVRRPPSCQFSLDGRALEALNDPLVDALLRNYPGILHYPTRLSESRLTRITRLAPPMIAQRLAALDRAGILSYAPAVNTPQIRLLQPRIRVDELRIDYARILSRKAVYTQRLQEMIGYMGATAGCRAQLINDYFGMPAGPRCGICDLCLATP
ncbi:MAG TPA: ATP-dependent DNA helicase RecQ [Dinghuibacter sp.]|uniref:RecQ family ATP-dependent DNA helicase n=1 Tax=Dinghuibacter sp. TaxID=2024697 RepID=UPI002C653010|nr:ATP-dependent DNA helicase RecQ [Dinghuibacter sp.]HTJ14949.1 ATP-dependent DNA helicase RecQ [Dinghuibacter sp.]